MDFVLPIAQRLARQYFNGPRNRRSQRKRKPKRSLAKSRANTRTSAPVRSLMQGSFSGSIRNYYTIGLNTSYYKTFTCADLISDQYASLASQFTEVRVNSARVYFYPSAGTSAAFSYATCLFDDTAANSTTAPTFGEICASPGSSVRRAWQSTGHHWKWTEPSDAEFQRISNTSNKLFVFQMATNSTTGLSGDLIVDASVIMRNQAGSITISLKTHMDLLSGHGITDSNWNEILRSAKQLKSRITNVSTSALSLEDLEIHSSVSSESILDS